MAHPPRALGRYRRTATGKRRYTPWQNECPDCTGSTAELPVLVLGRMALNARTDARDLLVFIFERAELRLRNADVEHRRRTGGHRAHAPPGCCRDACGAEAKCKITWRDAHGGGRAGVYR